VGVLPAVLFWNRTAALIVGAFLFAVFYVFGYARLARFRSPVWLIVRRARSAGDE